MHGNIREFAEGEERAFGEISLADHIERATDHQIFIQQPAGQVNSLPGGPMSIQPRPAIIVGVFSFDVLDRDPSARLRDFRSLEASPLSCRSKRLFS
ncbi:hypothetical protein [Bradyrhizobium japonicum]|uniref:hypothetical protein n=1 Tax=Bradyrhizobium japonicum TaxID=375 RepID=UPI000462BC81|nr:hypothetical protein [Bradyrhizobium japonicum]